MKLLSFNIYNLFITLKTNRKLVLDNIALIDNFI